MVCNFYHNPTRLYSVYFMKEKSKVERLFKILCSMIENSFKLNSEFFIPIMEPNILRKSLDFFFKEKGIHHQTTCVDTPQQNGIAERKNKHLLEVSRAIMFSINVPKYLWGGAILIASYLINRTPIHVLNYIPPLDCFQKYFLES